MFSLVHFSRVFPYIHPYLFPIETPNTDAPDAGNCAPQVCPDPAAGQRAASAAESAAALTRSGQGRHLKSLHRRHLRSQRNDALTYSGALRHTAW